VMIIAITPSLNAAKRSLPIRRSLLDQTAFHYQGERPNLTMGVYRLDDENNEGGQSICQNGVWQGPVANRDTGEHLGRRKG
jgi:hypothetical protein